MPVIDMSKPEARRDGMASGLIWNAPRGAIVKALEEVKAGLIPPPTFIPAEWEGLARQHGVVVAPGPDA